MRLPHSIAFRSQRRLHEEVKNERRGDLNILRSFFVKGKSVANLSEIQALYQMVTLLLMRLPHSIAFRSQRRLHEEVKNERRGELDIMGSFFAKSDNISDICVNIVVIKKLFFSASSGLNS